MDKQSLAPVLKKLKALSGAIMKRFPSRKVQSWAENLAIFQRTQPVTFKDANFKHDPNVPLGKSTARNKTKSRGDLL